MVFCNISLIYFKNMKTILTQMNDNNAAKIRWVCELNLSYNKISKLRTKFKNMNKQIKIILLS